MAGHAVCRNCGANSSENRIAGYTVEYSNAARQHKNLCDPCAEQERENGVNLKPRTTGQ